jgi:hypothetical protein
MITRTFTSLILIAGLLLSLCAVGQASQNRLLDVRVGMHKSFERVVFELAEQATVHVTMKPDQKIEVRFSELQVPQDFSLPDMPRDIEILKRIDAYREGDTNVVFELTLSEDAIPSELPLAGSPWRLAIDLAPRTAQAPPPPPAPKPEPKPEYIPGDLPIPTKLAGVDAAEDTAGISPAISPDASRVYATLAYFYIARGDTAKAREQADLYQKATGKTLDLTIPQAAQQAQAPTPTAPAGKNTISWWVNKIRHITIPQAGILAAIFIVGLLGGLVLHRVIGGWRPPRLSLPHVKFKRKERPAKVDVAEELEEGLQALEEAVAQEPPRKAAPAAPPPEPEPVLQAEDEVKESLMDRRVRRVLELSREGRTVTAIAEELQMGQDEVKLILDLNQ